MISCGFFGNEAKALNSCSELKAIYLFRKKRPIKKSPLVDILPTKYNSFEAENSDLDG